jgi:hypothetical protein
MKNEKGLGQPNGIKGGVKSQRSQGGGLLFKRMLLQWNPDNRSGVFTKMVKSK